MHLRVCIAAAVAILLLLLGPAVAHANHSFSVSKSEAAAGDEVEFQISGTQAGESYIVKVDDHEVASGVDSAGNGVSDKFKMPDFGGSNQSVSVEVNITPLGGEPNHLASQAMQYLAAFDEKNAAKFCNAERERLGVSEFRRRYATNKNEANAFGQCVRESARR